MWLLWLQVPSTQPDFCSDLSAPDGLSSTCRRLAPCVWASSSAATVRCVSLLSNFFMHSVICARAGGCERTSQEVRALNLQAPPLHAYASRACMCQAIPAVTKSKPDAAVCCCQSMRAHGGASFILLPIPCCNTPSSVSPHSPLVQLLECWCTRLCSAAAERQRVQPMRRRAHRPCAA